MRAQLVNSQEQQREFEMIQSYEMPQQQLINNIQHLQLQNNQAINVQ